MMRTTQSRGESRATVQRKSTVDQPGDALEEEADEVAEQVMRMPAPSLPNIGVSRPVRGLQTKGFGSSNEPAHIPAIVEEVTRSPGRPLDAQTRAFMEPRFGRDLSAVRVHTDAKAAESARSVQARAYTLGKNIVFGAGELSPAAQGQKLLAHELVHVLQQGSTPALQRKLSDDDVKRLEAEHRASQQRVYQQIEPDTTWDYLRRGDPNPSTLTPEQRAKDPHVIFNNSVEWIRSGRITLNVLTPVPGEASEKRLTVFDPTVNYPNLGGSASNTIEFEKKVDAKTDDKSMQLVVTPNLGVERLRELMRHEIQHVADAHHDEARRKQEEAEFEKEQKPGLAYRGQMNATIWNSYQTEFNGHWLESVARPAVQYGMKADGSVAEGGGSGPGGRSGYDKFGSESGPGGELKVAGRDKLPDQSIKLQNEKQTNIARFIIGHYFGMEETFLASQLFRDKVKALERPQGANLVNSMRIERLRQAMHGPATRRSLWLRAITREEDVANAVKALNDTDLAFLKDRGGGALSAPGPSALFWSDAQRQMSKEFVAWMEDYILRGNKQAPPPIPQQEAVQRKAIVGSADDPSEREADAMAEHVMSTATPYWPIPAADDFGPELRAQPLGARANGAGKEAPSLVDDVIGSAGQPLDAQTRAFMEPRFGRDFSDVRIHVDSAAASSAGALGARAYTVGSRIAFGKGEYRPEMESGRRLLAHELAHVAQQRSPTMLNRKVELRPPGKNEHSAFERRQELVDRLNALSQAIQYHLVGRQLKCTIVDAPSLSTFDQRMADFLSDDVQTIPMRLITKEGRDRRHTAGKVNTTGRYEPVFVDTFVSGYVDLDDLLASDDTSFKLSLIHVLAERAATANYAKRLGTNFKDGEFKRAHDKAREEDVPILQNILGDPTLKLQPDQSGEDSSDPRDIRLVFRYSSDKGYSVLRTYHHRNSDLTTGETKVETTDGRRLTIEEFLRNKAVASPSAGAP